MRFLGSLLVLLFVCTFFSYGQIKRIEKTINPLEAESHLRFLTADELKGRDTGSEELIIAGRYIAEQFRKFGLSPLGDQEDDYFQRVPLVNITSASSASAQMLEREFKNGEDLIVLSGSDTDLEGEMVLVDDLNNLDSYDLQGKIVLTVLGDNSTLSTPTEALKKSGAVGIIEIYRPGWRYPWPLMMNYLNREKISIGAPQNADGLIPHVWVRDPEKELVGKFKAAANKKASINIQGIKEKTIKAYNVIGKIEGTDPELKNEHIIMTAHYDHVGIQKTDDPDSIYNGTRDNGIGTTGVINAAQYFSQHPTKRSIIFMALTAEEKGLLGSRYYADSPKIPLEQTVFNFNIDNSGYTDTEHIWLLDTNRTNIDKHVYQAAAEVGLKVMGDRVPAQNYFERSDQASFAFKGVPAVNFKMSMTAYDERITEFYHKPSDEFHTVDMDYIHKYWKAYIRATELIGNWNERPFWVKGDKFEPVGRALYGEN